MKLVDRMRSTYAERLGRLLVGAEGVPDDDSSSDFDTRRFLKLHKTPLMKNVIQLTLPFLFLWV